MALIKKAYEFCDLTECIFDVTPSLDLPHFKVDKVYMPKDGGKYMLFLAHIKKTYKPKSGCPTCHSHDLIYQGLTSKPRLVHDVIRNNYRVDIAIAAPRMQCKTCKRIFTPKLPGISGSRQMTERLEELLRKECFLQPWTVLAERCGFSRTTISNIMDEEIDKYEAYREKYPMKAPRALGIDEKNIGDILRGTITDIDNGYLIDMMEDNKENTMKEAIKRLKGWQNIQVITTDMNNRYIGWIETMFPQATIVVDKYHVIQDLEVKISSCRKALYEFRKKRIAKITDLNERKRQLAILRIAGDNPRLFNYSIARLAREKEAVKAKKLSTVVATFPEFEKLHNLHYCIEYLYEQTTREDADEVWMDWLKLLPPDKDKDYKAWCVANDVDEDCFRMFRSFSRIGFQQFAPYILNYFNSPGTRVTNAVTEGLNSLIGDINIDGKGYEFKHLRAKALYASLIHERINYGIKMKTIPKWDMSNSMAFMSQFSAGSMPELTFTRCKTKYSVPRINLLGDNSWLTPTLSDEFVRAREEEYRKSHIYPGMSKADYIEEEICSGDEESLIAGLTAAIQR